MKPFEIIRNGLFIPILSRGLNISALAISFAILGCFSFLFLVTMDTRLLTGRGISDIDPVEAQTLSFDPKEFLKDSAFIQRMRSRQHQRLNKLEKSCWTEKRKAITKDVFGNIIVDDEHHLLYCGIAKVASTNWRRVLLVLSGAVSPPAERVSADAVHHSLSVNLSTLNEFSRSDIAHRLDTYLTFIFVRNPLERLLSAYRNKFATPYSDYFRIRFGRTIIRLTRKNPSSESLKRGHDVTFAEFIKYLILHENKTSIFNEHWQLYKHLCSPCRIRYDLIGKYETFNEDAAYVLILSGGSHIKFPVRTSPVQTSSLLATEYSKIPRSDMDRLFRLYEDDFKQFGYETKIPDVL